ncbi:MAG: hypothetical protein L3J93_00650 [Thermoplasmata archaeon]|nr:hypothetical protein [Thermoplasmata archaeon]
MRTRLPRPRREKELAPAVQSFLEGRGYRVWIDPDGTDYFDVVARSGSTIGLVELKISDGRTVLRQAIRRRGWADWVAVAVPSRALAARIAARSVAERGRRVGVWAVEGGTVEVIRPEEPLALDAEPNPLGVLKEALLERLDLLEAGTLAPGIPWGLPEGARHGLPGGRSSRDWRLEEFTSVDDAESH